MKDADYNVEKQGINFRKISLSLPFVLLITMVLLSFWHGRLIPGKIIIERQVATKYGIIEGFLLVAAFFFMFIILSVKRASFTIKKEHKTAFALMVAWILILITALLEGIVFENNFNYIIGDFYKFIRFPLIFFLVYFLTKSIRDMYFFYFILMVVWTAFASVEIFQFRGEIMSSMRLTSYSVLAGGTFLPFSLFFTRLNLRKSFKILNGIAIALAFLTLIISQTRRGIIGLLLTVIIFFYLSKKCGVRVTKKRTYLTPLLCFSVSLFIFLSIFVLKDFLKAPISSFGYRFRQISGSEDGFISGFIKIGGTRIPEVLTILDEFSKNPERVLGGFGLGSEFRLGSEFQGDRASGHFVHIGLAEIFFRMGGIGLILFLWTFIYFAKHALSKIKGNIHFLLPGMIGTISLISIFLGGNPFLNPIFIAPVFAGMLRATVEKKC